MHYSPPDTTAGHFRDVLPGQSLSMVHKKLNLTNKSKHRLLIYIRCNNSEP